MTRTLQQQIMQELQAIGFANATDFMAVDGGELVIRDTADIPRDLRGAVASMEKGSGGVKLKFYDKLKALELLGKILGLFDGAGGASVEENNLLEVLSKALGEEVDGFDLPELQQAAAAGNELVEPSGLGGV